MSIKYGIINYIRKYRTFLLKVRFYIFFFRRPIDKNKIVVSCHSGRSFGCNPKYIVQEIIRQKLPYKIVWLIRNEFLNKNEYPKEIEFVDYDNNYKRFKELFTAKLWIDNIPKLIDYKKGLIKKKNRFYLQTWHGSLGIKKCTMIR